MSAAERLGIVADALVHFAAQVAGTVLSIEGAVLGAVLLGAWSILGRESA